MSITNSIRHKSRSKIPGEVKSVTSLEPVTSTQTENQEEQHQRQQIARPNIRVVLERKNDKHQNGTGDKLGKEHIRSRQKSLRIRAKDASSGRPRRRHRPLPIALEVIDRSDVIDINDAGGTKPAEELSEQIDRKTPPGQLAVETAGKGDGRIEERTGVARNVDAEHDADAPAATTQHATSARMITRGEERRDRARKGGKGTATHPHEID